MEASWHHLPNAKDLRCYLQQGPHLPVDVCGSRVLADVDVDVMSTCISDVPKWVSVFLMNVRIADQRASFTSGFHLGG